ncbi:MAG: hypothetical protein IJ088_09615, partial [Clostridia bacterium]|nr:hypothetical protein [Clostridia bacterium]
TFIPHKNVGVQSLWISKLYAHQLHSTWFTQFVVKAFILAHSIFGGTLSVFREKGFFTHADDTSPHPTDYQKTDRSGHASICFLIHFCTELTSPGTG